MVDNTARTLVGVALQGDVRGVTPGRVSEVAVQVISGFKEVVTLGIVESDRFDLIQEAINVV